MKTGQFINYLAPFGTGHSADLEATKLLDTADSLIKAGCKGVGYIYSSFQIQKVPRIPQFSCFCEGFEVYEFL